MLENVSQTLESLVMDISTSESALLSVEEQQVLAYSRVELEGDQTTYVNPKVDQEAIELHASLTSSALQGKMAMIKMAGTVLQIIKPI